MLRDRLSLTVRIETRGGGFDERGRGSTAGGSGRSRSATVKEIASRALFIRRQGWRGRQGLSNRGRTGHLRDRQRRGCDGLSDRGLAGRLLEVPLFPPGDAVSIDEGEADLPERSRPPCNGDCLSPSLKATTGREGNEDGEDRPGAVMIGVDSREKRPGWSLMMSQRWPTTVPVSVCRVNGDQEGVVVRSEGGRARAAQQKTRAASISG